MTEQPECEGRIQCRNSRSNWNLEMLIFEKGGKPENPEKKPRSKGQEPTTNSDPHKNRTRNTLVGGERSITLPPSHNITATSREQPLRSVAKVAVVVRFDCSNLSAVQNRLSSISLKLEELIIPTHHKTFSHFQPVISQRCHFYF